MKRRFVGCGVLVPDRNRRVKAPAKPQEHHAAGEPLGIAGAVLQGDCRSMPLLSVLILTMRFKVY